MKYFRLRPKKHAEVRPKALRRLPREPKRSNDKLHRYLKAERLQDLKKKGKGVSAAKRALLFLNKPKPRQVTPIYWIEPEEPSAALTLSHLRDTISYQNETPRKTVCEKRHERQEVLFAKGIAGHSRKSPGRNGTYNRTVDSSVSCERK